jgi:hypothetical protein
MRYFNMAYHPSIDHSEDDFQLQDSDYSTGSEEDSVVDTSPDDNLQSVIASHVRANVNQSTVKVPCSHTPFSDLTQEALFDAALQDLRDSSLIPAGYGLR